MNIQRGAAELAKVSINVNESAWRTRGAVEEKKRGGQMPRDGIRIRIEQPRRRWIVFHRDSEILVGKREEIRKIKFEELLEVIQSHAR